MSDAFWIAFWTGLFAGLPSIIAAGVAAYIAIKQAHVLKKLDAAAGKVEQVKETLEVVTQSHEAKLDNIVSNVEEIKRAANGKG